MLTADQIAARVHSIGSSDSAAVCGVNQWKTAYDCWLEKTGRVEPFAGNAATSAGDRLEKAVLEYAIDKLATVDTELSPDVIYSESVPFMSARLDCRAVLETGENVIIEGKTSGIVGRLNDAEWGEEWSDQIPDAYKVQVAHQLFVAGPAYDFAIVSALLGGLGFVLYSIQRDAELLDAIVEKCAQFWQCVKTDTPPDSSPSIDVVKRLRKVPGKVVPINWELVASLQRAKADLKAAQDEEERAKAAVLLALGDAEAGESEAGGVTYFDQVRKAYTVKESTSRVLRIKEKK